MRVHFDPRAQVAFRSLNDGGQTEIMNVTEALAPATENDWQEIAGAQKLHVMNGEVLYSLRAGADLRLLGKVISGQLIVQDIFPRERLERISGQSLS